MDTRITKENAFEELHKVCERLKHYKKSYHVSKRARDIALLSIVINKHGTNYHNVKGGKSGNWHKRSYPDVYGLIIKKAYIQGFIVSAKLREQI